MAPVKDRWSAEYRPTLEDIEIHLQEDAWDRDQHSDVPAYHKRRTAGLWTALASLAVVLAVVTVYGYSVISNHNARLVWLSGLVQSVSAVRMHIDGVEANLKEWKGKQESLAAQVQKLNTGWKSGLNKVSQHAAELVANAYQKEQGELNQRTANLNAQIAEMTSRQNAEHVHVAQLERELASTQQELASVRADYTRELAALQQRQISSQQKIASLDNVLSTDQVDFEAQKNHDEEIVPGVSLHLTTTDTAHQQYGGWIWLARNRRTIWVRRQAIESPQVFYPVPGGEAYELVVTRVSPKEVAGYILIPSDTGSQQADVASNSKPITSAGRGSF